MSATATSASSSIPDIGWTDAFTGPQKFLRLQAEIRQEQARRAQELGEVPYESVKHTTIYKQIGLTVSARRDKDDDMAFIEALMRSAELAPSIRHALIIGYFGQKDQDESRTARIRRAFQILPSGTQDSVEQQVAALIVTFGFSVKEVAAISFVPVEQVQAVHDKYHSGKRPDPPGNVSTAET